MVKVIMHGCNGHMGQVITQLVEKDPEIEIVAGICLLYTSPSPRDGATSRMPSSA